jgi:non-heme chloroperoxidase
LPIDEAGAGESITYAALTLADARCEEVCPVLAIYTIPDDLGPPPKEHPELFEARKAEDAERVSAQADAFAEGNPQARVIRLANANHRIFQSNPQDVLREMNAFIATLPN